MSIFTSTFPDAMAPGGMKTAASPEEDWTTPPAEPMPGDAEIGRGMGTSGARGLVAAEAVRLECDWGVAAGSELFVIL